MRGLRVYPVMIKRNLERFGAFAGTEAVMMELAAKGEDRQAAHERIRVKSFAAWDAVMKGEPNPLERLLSEDKAISSKLTREQIKLLLDPSTHTGDAQESCDDFLKKVVAPILAGHKKAPHAKVEY